MSRRRLRWLVAIALLAVLAGGAIWWFTRDRPVSHKLPATAPAYGSCWQVDAATARGPFPWPGRPTGCTSGHTAQVYYTGQVDDILIRTARGSGTDASAAKVLMAGEVRHSCEAAATALLGDEWRRHQVTVLANWISPSANGFYACALAQTTDAAGSRLATRTAPIAKADADALAISCVGGGAYLPCTEAHDAELVGTYTLTPPNAPFDEASVRSAATAGCTSVARQYLGLPAGADRSDLAIAYVGPTTTATWLGSDQTFACYARADVKLRGSIRSLGTRPLPS